MIRHSRMMALGIMLSVLAALFFVEAKTAWFSPAGSACAQISFNKARPAEPLKMLAQRFTSPAPVAHDLVSIAILAAAALVHTTALITRPAAVHRPLPISSGFSAALFFRPPPVR